MHGARQPRRVQKEIQILDEYQVMQFLMAVKGNRHEVLFNLAIKTGMRITRQGLRVYRDQLLRREDPRKRPYYWIGGESPTGIPADGTDFWAVSEGYISITPLKLDLTDQQVIQDLSKWDW